MMKPLEEMTTKEIQEEFANLAMAAKFVKSYLMLIQAGRCCFDSIYMARRQANLIGGSEWDIADTFDDDPESTASGITSTSTIFGTVQVSRLISLCVREFPQ